jgi:Fe-S-cluster containining protein
MTADFATTSLAQLQRERLPLAMQRAQAKLASLAADASAGPLLKASQRAKTVAQRVIWLQRAASAWAKPIEAVSACRTGCSHCCQIPVTISLVEAQLLSRASGRVLSAPQRSVRFTNESSIESLAAKEGQLQAAPQAPCPFLQAGRCSVYEMRPMACRTLLNLDDDDLLCRHAEGAPGDVPYADATKLRAFAVLAQPGTHYADIREFFPGMGRVQIDS